MIGDAAPHCDDIVEAYYDDPSLMLAAVALFADQAKAFERLSLAWYALALAS